MNSTVVPLCVDLDGTLLRTDTLYESLLVLVRREPLSLLRLPLWLMRGRAYFKREVAARTLLDPAVLPYNEELLAWLGEQRRNGRELVLVTAADERIANGISAHLRLFDRVLASDGVTNLGGETKRAGLVKEFGERGYDYVGDSRRDVPVWRSAREAIVVSNSESLKRRAAAATTVGKTLAVTRPSALAWFKALRVHQWAKNLLVFLPLLLAQQFGSTEVLERAVWAFLAFSLCASSVYVLNDLLDLESDRLHPRKRQRPFASGVLDLRAGMLLAPLLLLGAFLLALRLNWEFTAVLGLYYLSTLAYSLLLKRLALMDVMLLAGLYTLRMIAGGAATYVQLSFWLLAFSMFIFLSLAISKRYAELTLVKSLGAAQAAGRGYTSDDLPLLRNLGISSGYGAVLVLALYINNPQAQMLYRHPHWLWMLCPLLLYWISRVWLLAHRGQMHDDPLVFALRDRISLVVAALGAITMICAH